MYIDVQGLSLRAPTRDNGILRLLVTGLCARLGFLQSLGMNDDANDALGAHEVLPSFAAY